MPMLRRFGATLIRFSASNTVRPPIAMRPPVGVSRPATVRIVEVLPQPDGPSSTSALPSSIVRSMPLTAWKSP
jgi:hypothetical protein